MTLQYADELIGVALRGDPVKVAGLRGQFTFTRLVTNPTTGVTWASVYGGSGGDGGSHQYRSVPPERVRKDKRR